MCNNHPAHTSPWLILAHQCTYYNIACLPANLSEDHTAVSGFSGSTSRATHKGDFNCVVRAQNGRLIHLVNPSAALVIPDSHRNLYSVRHAQHSGHTVILGAQAGLLPYGDPDLFVPFFRRQIHWPLASTITVQPLRSEHRDSTAASEIYLPTQWSLQR